ncbi:MAG TPA: class I SAM-dependent methyltransferase [Gemmatimonadaceae bacterium]
MLKTDSDRDWEWYGAREPYFGVLTNPRFLRADLTDRARAEFFESGERYVESLLDTIGRHVGSVAADARVLDFGCGVGRLAIPFARRFAEVVGVDVAPSMLEEARRNCTAAGLKNVALVPGDDRLSRVTGSFDFVHSFIVFQHVPVARGEAITQRILELLRADGIGALHFTYRTEAGRVRHLSNWLQARTPGLRRVVNVIRRRDPGTAVMQMNEYSLSRLMHILHDAGCDEVCARAVRHGDETGVRAHGVMLIFRKRKLPEL